MNDLANMTGRPDLLDSGERLEHAPKGGETHHAYLARLERNQAAIVGALVTTHPTCGWRRFIVVGIARDGWRLRVRRLRTGDGYMNKGISLIDPKHTNVAHYYEERRSCVARRAR